MKLDELTSLVAIRSYVVDSSGNASLDRKTVKYMNDTLILLDKKIVSILEGEEFKEYINYKDVRKAIEDVVNNNNIKSGLQRNAYGQLEKIPK